MYSEILNVKPLRTSAKGVRWGVYNQDIILIFFFFAQSKFDDVEQSGNSNEGEPKARNLRERRNAEQQDGVDENEIIVSSNYFLLFISYESNF